VFKEVHGVTIFLESENEILILLRSEKVSTYQSRWGGISGAIEDDMTADEQALLELREETGLSSKDVNLIRKGEPLSFDDNDLNLRKVVYPYLFHVRDRHKIKINWEHKEMRWVKPDDIDNYSTMPKLKETLAQVWSGPVGK
jgi:8-oxo-dGTP pyrophosphatase MutT (NUDIX family)